MVCRSLILSVVISLLLLNAIALGDIISARKWIDSEFQPSVLSREQQEKELKWFIKAAKPFKGMEIKVVSETIAVHTYESEVLTKAFEEITGIKVKHDLISEGDVIEKLQIQMLTERNIYDIYINDSDLIGTHFRYGHVIPLSDFILGQGKGVTLPSLDLDDFIGLSFTTAPDGKIYQLPDQQFANLYWFRYDWFKRRDLRKRFRKLYGYNLGVPLNWSAYEDIADFFTNRVKVIDGKRIYGHMDYGKKSPDLGWRFTDAWLSMAGVGSKGLPNGLPVDEWGIRVKNCQPVGASVERGGAVNSPAAVYALKKYRDWFKYAPPKSDQLNFYESGPVPGQGHIAQQIFWYTTFIAQMMDPKLPVVDDKGAPKWRIAPSPHGVYWEKGMKLGYQDTGSWTILKSTPLERRKAAWLYAQFVVSKTVDLKRFTKGFTPIRKSTINSDFVTKLAPKLGGLIEFYRSPARVMWTPTGTNVPDYPKLSQLWWHNISLVVTGDRRPQEALDRLASQMDRVMGRLEAVGMARCAPKLNPKSDRAFWLSQPGSPKAKLSKEKPPGQTIDYDTLIAKWKSSRENL